MDDLGPAFAFVGAIAAAVGCAWSPGPIAALVGVLLVLAMYRIGRSVGGERGASFLLVALCSWGYATAAIAPHLVSEMICTSPAAILPLGLFAGVGVFAALAVPLLVFQTAARRPRAARARSLAGASERRLVWAVGLMPFTVFGGLVVMARSANGSGLRLLGTLALVHGAQLAFLVADALVLRRIRHLRAHAQRLPLVAHDIAARRVDLGVGDALRGQAEGEPTYREAAPLSLVIAGDADASAEAARACLRIQGKCLAGFYGALAAFTLLGWLTF